MKGYRKPRVTIERLKEVLAYDASTGIFTWKIRMGAHALPGGIAGTVSKRGRRHIAIDRVQFVAHRLAWMYVHGEWPTFQLDHRNLDKLDDRIDNLRPATNQGNAANCRAHRTNRLGIKGVGMSTQRGRRPQRYRARIRVNDQLIHLGYFASPIEASAAYAAAAAKHFGEFARSA